MLRRLDDWPSRLRAFIRSRRELPFAWGSNDCCTFAIGGGVEALTGVLLLPDVQRPTTELGAARFLLDRGHRDASGLATELLGEPLATPRLAQRGDVVALPADEGVTLGICLGTDAAAPGPSGLVFAPLSCALKAWRV
jgi:hypothetical protein